MRWEVFKTSDDIIYRNYAVAFINVFGQKELFKGFSAISLANNDLKLIEVHKQTVFHIEHLQSWFEDFFKSTTEETECAYLVPEAKREQFKAMVRSEIKTYRFSDCFLAFTSL